MTSRNALSELQGSLTNILSVDEQYFSTGIGSWSATNANIFQEVGFRFKDIYHTLRVVPQSSSSVALQVEPKQISNSLATDFITFYCGAYCTKRTQFDIFIYEYPSNITFTLIGSVQKIANLPATGNTLSDAYFVDEDNGLYIWISGSPSPYWERIGNKGSKTVVANALTWTIIRGPEVEVASRSSQTTVVLQITASAHQGAHFHIGHPTLTNTYHLLDNLFLRQCMTYMPEVLIETDRNQTSPDFPMLRIMDIGTLYANRGLNQYINFQYKDIAAGYKESDSATKSTLVNPDVAPLNYLPWLAQIVGVRITQVGSGTTPWGNLPGTWETLSQAVDDAPTGDDDDIAEWQEIETFDIADSNFAGNAREQIKTAQTGLNAGLTKSLEVVLIENLRGDKEYKIYSDPVTYPWTIIVRTLVSETPGGQEGQPSESLILKLNKSKPLGFVIDHQCVTAL